jgi:Fe-S-cluster containining protein
MPLIKFIPWRQISNWRCIGCGECCKDYSVVLDFPEWLTIAQTFGAENVVRGLDRLFIRRLPDGRCAFLCQLAGLPLCGLQNMKPNACKLWPFKVLTEPRYGDENQAVFEYIGKRLYIYADSNCAGLKYGSPNWEFSALTLREFADIALGTCRLQRKSTRGSSGYYTRIF